MDVFIEAISDARDRDGGRKDHASESSSRAFDSFRRARFFLLTEQRRFRDLVHIDAHQIGIPTFGFGHFKLLRVRFEFLERLDDVARVVLQRVR